METNNEQKSDVSGISAKWAFIGFLVGVVVTTILLQRFIKK